MYIFISRQLAGGQFIVNSAGTLARQGVEQGGEYEREPMGHFCYVVTSWYTKTNCFKKQLEEVFAKKSKDQAPLKLHSKTGAFKNIIM